MKKLGIIIGALVVLLVGGAVAGIAVLKSMDFNQYKGLIAEQAKAATGRDLNIAGNLELEISLNPSLVVQGVTFSNAAWGSRPEMAKLGSLEARVAIMPLFSGTVQVERLVLKDIDVLLETDKNGKGNWEFGEPAAKEKAAPSEGPGKLPVVNLVHLKNVKATFKDGMTGETMAAVVDSLELGADGTDSPLSLRLQGSYNGAAYEVAGKLCSVDILSSGGACAVDLSGGAVGVKFGVDGKIAKPMEGKGIDLGLTLDVPSPAGTVEMAAVAVPQLKDAGPVPDVPVTFSGKLRDPAGTYAVEGMKLTFGESDLSGRLAVALGGKRPKVDAQLASTLLDVDSLLPPTKNEPKPAPAASKSKRVFPADPLPLDGLKAADADLTFKGTKILASGFDIRDVDVGISLANGKLTVKPLVAKVFEGLIGGSAVVDASAAVPNLVIDVTAKQVDYGKALAHFGQAGAAEGKVDAIIDVKGTGDSVRALMAGLTGKLRIVAENGKIDSGALNIASADVTSALPFMKSEGDKDLRCAVVHFDIQNGMADARSIVIETGGLSVVGTGKVNLKTEGLDLRVTPRAKKASVAKLAEVSMIVGGVMAEPNVHPDEMETAKAVAGTAATVAGAVATGGVSLLGQVAAGKASESLDKTDYCTPALAGKKVTPEEPEAASDTGGGSQEPSTTEKAADTVKGVGESLGKGLKGLFGN